MTAGTLTIEQRAAPAGTNRIAAIMDALPPSRMLLPAPDSTGRPGVCLPAIGNRNTPAAPSSQHPAPKPIGSGILGTSYYTRAQAQEILGVAARREAQIMADVPDYLIRNQAQGRGRPTKLYHFTAHPALTAHHYESRLSNGTLANNKAKAKTIDPADLETARLRAQAVEEYQARCNHDPEAVAADVTCAEWARRPRTAEVKVVTRLKHSHGKTRTKTRQITVGPFSARTLRTWASTYKSNILNLVPRRKGRSGRNEIQIPDRIINLIHFYATRGPRARYAAAISRVRDLGLPDFPDCSDDTLLRRIREIDPGRFAETLGRKGIASFNLDCLPDIEMDETKLGLNDYWELDDVEMDFYCHSEADPAKLVRIKGYAIIRVSTREILTAVLAETPITKKQVWEMVGTAMASNRCGIPGNMKFERGTLACDAQLQQKIEACGCNVRRTSMDGGKIHPGAIADKSKGHFVGKAKIERFFKSLHELLWDTIGQVGPNERHTAHANLETVKAESIQRVKDGAEPLLPTMAQARAMVVRAMEIYNTRPHSGLPEFPGQKRHYTPLEWNAKLGGEIKVLDERLLPMFLTDAFNVKVTRNGCRINNESYGRFDDDLKTLDTATLHVAADHPDIAYCLELGRCIERYDKTTREQSADQYRQRMHQSNRFRNQFEQMVASAENTIADITVTTTDPTPTRPATIVTPDPLAERDAIVRQGVKAHRESQASQTRRFDLEESRLTPQSSRSGLLAKADNIRSQVDMLSTPREEDDPFSI
jgi:hypothetical protein